MEYTIQDPKQIFSAGTLICEFKLNKKNQNKIHIKLKVIK